MPPTTVAVLAEQIKFLTEAIEGLRCDTRVNTDTLQSLKLEYATEHIKVDKKADQALSRANEAHARIDEQNKVIKSLTDIVEKFTKEAEKIFDVLKWIARIGTAIAITLGGAYLIDLLIH